MGYQSGPTCPRRIARIRCLRALGAWRDDESPLEIVAAPTNSCATGCLLARWNILPACNLGVCALAAHTWAWSYAAGFVSHILASRHFCRLGSLWGAIWTSRPHGFALCLRYSDYGMGLPTASPTLRRIRTASMPCHLNQTCDPRVFHRQLGKPAPEVNISEQRAMYPHPTTRA